jgi:transposase
MDTRWTLGIDLGITSKHTAVLFDRACGKAAVKPIQFAHTAGEFKEFLARVKKSVGEEEVGGVQVVMEPTGNVWVALAGYLREQGMEILMPCPTLAAAYRKKRQQGGKSNRIDAETLARLPQAEREYLNPACLRDPKSGDLHRWCKFHEKVTKRIGGIKNSIRSLFQLVSPQMLKCFGDDPFTAMGRRFMRRYANPVKLLSRGPQRVIQVLSQGRETDREEATPIVQNLFACAHSAVEMYRPMAEGHGMSFSFDMVQHQVSLRLDELELYEREGKEVEERIAALHAEIEPEAVSRSLPGFGKHIAAVVDSTVADIRRFPSAESFVGYVRCAPRQRSTGKGKVPVGEHERQPLRKGGNRYLQKQLYLAAEVARRYDVECAHFYLKLKARGRHHSQCVIAVARRLALRYYALKKRQLRDPKARYQFRDLDGRPITKREAKQIVDRLYEEAEPKKPASSSTPASPPAAARFESQAIPLPLPNGPQKMADILAVLVANLGVTPEALARELGHMLPERPSDHHQNSAENAPKPLAST